MKQAQFDQKIWLFFFRIFLEELVLLNKDMTDPSGDGVMADPTEKKTADILITEKKKNVPILDFGKDSYWILVGKPGILTKNPVWALFLLFFLFFRIS